MVLPSAEEQEQVATMLLCCYSLPSGRHLRFLGDIPDEGLSLTLRLRLLDYCCQYPFLGAFFFSLGFFDTEICLKRLFINANDTAHFLYIKSLEFVIMPII